jgi:hypothetical protein
MLVLPTYYLHLKNGASTLIARFYGAYTVNIEGLASIHLVMMENTT